MNFIIRKAAFCLPEGVAMVHISYTMSTRGLPDMYTRSPRAAGPWASGVHGITITYIYIYMCVCVCVCVYVLLKALPPVCMKYTARDESRVANII